MGVMAEFNDEWRDLMRRAQNGDRAAYGQLLEGVLPWLRRYVGRRWSRPDGQEDLVQEILISLHRARRTYDPARPFEPWLAAIARHRLLDAGRRHRRDPTDPVAEVPETETFSISQANREAREEDSPYGDPGKLRQVIATLPRRQRQAIELVKIREMTFAEASRASGVSISALKVAVHRGIKTLRLRLSAGDVSEREQ